MVQAYQYFGIVVFLILSNTLYGSALKCYRCGTLTHSSGPGRTNESGFSEPYTATTADEELPVDILQLESCDEFDGPDASKYLYEITCSVAESTESQVCAKIVTFTYEIEGERESDYDEEVNVKRKRSVQRGCASAVTALGKSHTIGCGFLEPPTNKSADSLIDAEHICYCDSNFCNFANTLQINFILVLPICQFIFAQTNFNIFRY